MIISEGLIEEKHSQNKTIKVLLNQSFEEEIDFAQQIKNTFTFQRLKEKIIDFTEIFTNYADNIHNKLGYDNDYRNLIIFAAAIFGLTLFVLLKSNLNFNIIIIVYFDFFAKVFCFNPILSTFSEKNKQNEGKFLLKGRIPKKYYGTSAKFFSDPKSSPEVSDTDSDSMNDSIR